MCVLQFLITADGRFRSFDSLADELFEQRRGESATTPTTSASPGKSRVKMILDWTAADASLSHPAGFEEPPDGVPSYDIGTPQGGSIATSIGSDTVEGHGFINHDDKWEAADDAWCRNSSFPHTS